MQMTFEAVLENPRTTSAACTVMPMAEGKVFGILCNWESPLSLFSFFVPSGVKVVISSIAIEGVNLCVDLPLQMPSLDHAEIYKFWELKEERDRIVVKVTYSVPEAKPFEVKLDPKLMGKFQVSVVKNAAPSVNSVKLPVFTEPAATGNCEWETGAVKLKSSVGKILEQFTSERKEKKPEEEAPEEEAPEEEAPKDRYCICTIDQKDHGEMVRDILLWNNEITLVPDQLNVRVYKMQKRLSEQCYVVPVEYHTSTDTVLFVAPISEEMTCQELYQDMQNLFNDDKGRIDVSLAGLNQTVALDRDDQCKVGTKLSRVVVGPMEKVTGYKLSSRLDLTIVVEIRNEETV